MWIYVFLHEPEFSTLTPLMAVISGVSIPDLVNLNCYVFCELFLKLRKFFQPYHNFEKKKGNIVWLIRFFGERQAILVVNGLCDLYCRLVKPTFLQCHYK
jgi:hypothetical protein